MRSPISLLLLITTAMMSCNKMDETVMRQMVTAAAECTDIRVIPQTEMINSNLGSLMASFIAGCLKERGIEKSQIKTFSKGGIEAL